jgi:diacylglycerol kinase family enzyme
VRLGVLPLGTANVFARELGLPAQLPAAWAILERGRELMVDVGVAEAAGGEPPRKRYFLQMAGVGWDARVAASVPWEHKKRIGQLAYVLAGVRALRGPHAEVTLTDGTHSLAGPLALIGNGRFYAGNWRVFPRADLRDGLLEATVFPRWNWFAVARAVLGIALRRVYTLGGARHAQAPVLRATSPEPLPFHVDAEHAGVLPARFSVLPRALRVIVP